MDLVSKPGVRKVLVISVVVVVLAAAAALLADVGVAIRSEHRLSRAIAESPRVPFDPEVTLTGFPFLTQSSDGRYSGATIAAKGVETPGCEPERGTCRAELGATLGLFDGPPGGRFSGSDVLHTSSISAYTRLDAVTLARYLRITDLTLSTPAPEGKAGGGGPQDGVVSRSEGVVLTGTVALPPSDGLDPRDPPSASDYDGPKVRVSVSVDLAVENGALRIRATDFYTGPERHVDADVPEDMRTAVLDRFSMVLPRLPMAWGLTPQRAESFGGDVQLVASRGPADLRLDRF
ncbi:LmeA family phospholipid-binding protein [Gordonia aurantiaca]|uniref:LmeA family phospholipid-binding protein n=1 Tax=Gordonia sp. B21 TaxID=3151852 RepID=UPI0032678851